MFESLHNHTTASDGTQDHLEVLASAERLGYGTIAFTDHDALPSRVVLDSLKSYTSRVKWLIGCEISSGLPIEMQGVNGIAHILGLFTDPHNTKLLEHCRLAVAAREERLERMVKNLKGLGFTISVDDCLAQSGGENVGRPHIVRALATHPENAGVIELIRLQMEEAAKTSPSVAMDYVYMMDRHWTDRPYRLFLSRDAFIPDVFVDYLYTIDLDSSVKLIREAGGRAFYAHWWTDRKFMPFEKVEELLSSGRIDGVEVRGGLIDEDVVRYGNQLKAVSERLGTPWTIGADSHRESDLAAYSRNHEVMSLASGQTERLIKRFKPELSSCSSL